MLISRSANKPAVSTSRANRRDTMPEFITSQYTVLVVDGDAQCRDAVARLLQRVGYRTRDYDRAGELLDNIDDIVLPACVICELALPDMTGLDLSRSLHVRHPQLPVIILTAESNVAAAVTAMRGKVADYLLKPYVERDLVQRLQNALTRFGAPLN